MRNKYFVEEFFNGYRFQLNSECVTMNPSYLEGGHVSDWNKQRASG